MPIIAFHDVSRGFSPGITKYPPKRFERLLDFLIACGFRFRRLGEYLESSETDGELVITFDDGYRSLLDRAVPAIQARQIPFAIFIPAGFAGKQNRWDYTYLFNKRAHLTPEELRYLSDSGVEIGSHGMTHICLTDLSDRLLRLELENSRKTLEDMTGREVTYLSYPFGRYNERVEVSALDAGYQRGFSLAGFRRSRLGFSISRRVVYYHDTLLAVGAKLKSGPLRPVEHIKESILNAYSYGTILYNRLLPESWRQPTYR
ncbi:MAG: polysaccharide deacetylase family protein [bacterium]|jgi:hypothetical protein